MFNQNLPLVNTLHIFHCKSTRISIIEIVGNNWHSIRQHFNLGIWPYYYIPSNVIHVIHLYFSYTTQNTALIPICRWKWIHWETQTIAKCIPFLSSFDIEIIFERIFQLYDLFLFQHLFRTAHYKKRKMCKIVWIFYGIWFSFHSYACKFSNELRIEWEIIIIIRLKIDKYIMF